MTEDGGHETWKAATIRLTYLYFA